MAREVKHTFSTKAEAEAFAAGVEFVNDSAVEVADSYVGQDEIGPYATVVLTDEEGGDDSYEQDHRKAAQS